MINYIVKLIVKYFKEAIQNFMKASELKKLRQDSKQKKKVSDEEVKSAERDYDDFMDLYESYRRQGRQDKD